MSKLRLPASFLFILLILCRCSEPVPEPVDPQVLSGNVYGQVTADGQGLPGVCVSDGVEVCVTDDRGRYTLKSEKENGYVFVSVPSGYEPARDGVFPKFYAQCRGTSEDREKIDFKLVKVNQSKARLLFFGDMHLAGRGFCKDIDQFRDFASEADALASSSGCPVYGITLGDMTWDYFWSSNNFAIPEYVKEVRKDFKSLILYHTMGNHDNDPSQQGDFLGERAFRTYLGPTFYSFNVSGVHIVVLDSMVYSNMPLGQRNFTGRLSDKQVEWLRKDLSYVDKDVPLILTMHTPLYYSSGSQALKNNTELRAILAGYQSVQFITAHMHVVYNVDGPDGISETNAGAVCGAWWMTRYACEYGWNICSDGAPSGYLVMDLSGAPVNSYYKGTGLPEDFQFRVYDGPSNQVLVNVWNWKPSWKVSVTENGAELPLSRLKDFKDPLYVAVYEDYEREHGYDVSYPCSGNYHTFRATASSASSPVSVRVEDEWGNVWTRTVSRPSE